MWPGGSNWPGGLQQGWWPGAGSCAGAGYRMSSASFGFGTALQASSQPRLQARTPASHDTGTGPPGSGRGGAGFWGLSARAFYFVS
jgi:hypothetical protein